MAKSKCESPRGDYEAFKVRQAERSRARSESGRDIGPLPDVEDRERREAGRLVFYTFAKTYCPDLFRLPPSVDHCEVHAAIEDVVLRGGLYPLAMPRGSGKTTLAEIAAVWALLYGHRRFVMIIGANKEKAVEILDRIKAHLETNDLLAADFPEVCHPLRSLERIYNRANGQTLDGEPTRIGWTKSQVILPTVAGSPSSGGILRVAGILGGGIRGAKHQAGKVATRPDLAIADDPQTAISARSRAGNTARLNVMKRDVVGLAGPGCSIACIMPCTVLVKNDMADRLLDRKQHPSWQGKRYKLLKAWPKRMDLWREYARMRAESQEAGGKGEEATAYYASRRLVMDEGAEPAWPARHLDHELSALQHCMNLYFDDPAGFSAEYQNEPPDESAGANAERLTIEGLAVKLLRNLPRAKLPRDTSRVTAFIDVQKLVLFWVAIGWNEQFGGAIVDYGAWPEQLLPDFRAAQPSPTLPERYPDAKGAMGPIYAGLNDLVTDLTGRAWIRDEIGDTLRVSRLLIDANWGESTKTVYQLCRDHPMAAVLTPSHGKGIGAAGRPFSQYKPNGLKSGPDWRQESGTNGIHVSYDTNAWKSFVSERLATPLGSHGSLGVFCGGVAPHRHRLLFEHFTSEYAVLTKGPWREVNEWKLQPGCENHWWDCVVGASVAASIDGLRYSDSAAAGLPTPAAKPKTVSFAEMQRRAQNR